MAYTLPGERFVFDESDTFKKLGLYRIAWKKSKAPQLLPGKTLITIVVFAGINYYRLVENQETIKKLYEHHNAGIINSAGLQFWAPSPLVETRVENQLVTGEIKEMQRNKSGMGGGMGGDPHMRGSQ